MKKCMFFYLCLCSVSLLHAQALKPVPDRVYQYHKAQRNFVEYSLFEQKPASAADETYKDMVSQYTLLRLNEEQLAKLLINKPQTLAFDFPYGQQNIRLELYRVQIASDNFSINTNQGVVKKDEPGVFYHGIIKGDYGSLVAFSFFKNEVMGIASSPMFGNINVGRLREPGNSTDYILYSDRYLLHPLELACSTKEAPLPQPITASNGNLEKTARTTKCLRIYYEISNTIYQQFGADAIQTANWATAVHNNTAALYANDGITVALSEIFVWTSPAPFVSLESFSAYRCTFNGDIAVGVGFGGLAWQGLLCAANNAAEGISVGNYCVTYGDTVLATVPLFSQSVYVNTHETGHVIGSSHTHQCVWNGNNTQIDDCGNTIPPPYPPGQEPGPCFDPQNPIIPANGTIMSYCEIYDFSQGFGPQPAQLIRDRVEGATCLGTDCITSCVSTIDSITVEVYSSAGLLTIYDSNPQANAWEVRTDFGNPWIPISTPMYQVPLWPNSQFNIQVREVCPGNFSANFLTGVYVQTPVSFCGQQTFDNGGQAYPYSRYYWWQTYFPDAPYKHVVFTFNGFDVNPADTLRIYNGPDTNASYVSYTGATLPPAVSSTHPSGALTLALIPSVGYNANMGWDISINCVATPTVAAFSVSDSAVCQGTQVSFTDISSMNPTAWNWSFPGGTPSGSVDQNPSVTYNTAGNYSVTLTVTNAGGTDVLTQNTFVQVHGQPAAPVVTWVGGSLSSNYATGNQWYGPAGIIAGATGQTYTPTQNGAYYAIYTDSNGCISSSGNVLVLTASVPELEIGDVRVFPNPVGTQFWVEWGPGLPVTDVRLYDVAGRLLYASGLPGTGSVVVNSGLWASGSYLLELVTPKGNLHKHLLK